MNLRNILLLLVALTIIVFNVWMGNAISWFLSVCITCSIFYYLFQMQFERSLVNRIRNAGNDPLALQKSAQLNRRVRAMAGFLLLSVLYIAAVFSIRNTSMPRDNSPYFFNNEHHAISNHAIYFNQELPLYTRQDIEDGARVIVSRNQIKTQDYFQPIFVEKESEGYQLLNKIFDAPIRNNFTLDNGKTRISIGISKEHNWWRKLWGKQARALYKVSIESSESELGGAAPLHTKDQFSFRGPWLQEGMSLYNIMFEQQMIQAPGAAAMQVLQDMMQQIGRSYLLAGEVQGEQVLYFFPEKEFVLQGYKLFVDGAEVQPKVSGTYTLPERFFYLGFHNQREKMKILAGDGGEAMLVFDHAPRYWLSVPAEQQVLNSQNVFFLTNDFDRVIDGKGKEGFYFNNFGLMTDASFEGRLNFAIGKPTEALQHAVQDLNGSHTEVKEELDFILNSDRDGIRFGFEIRNFADNGFAFEKLLWYAGMVYLGFVALIVFFPGKDLARIEPVIYTTIFGLFVVRMLMYWRLATFPPLDNISKYELEQTILNFDFNLFGKLPIPLTVVWLLAFMVVLAVYRSYTDRIKLAYQRLVDKTLSLGKMQVVRTYALLILALFVMQLFFGKVLGIEMFNRVLGIIAPIMLYLFFTNISNRNFNLDQRWVQASDGAFVREVKAFFYYLIYNPAFLISLFTLAYLALADRGFAILFMLFLLLKNILFNFLKKSYDSNAYSFGQMVFRPNNYWVYGITALIVYFVILSVKPFFHYVLMYYMWIIGAMLFLGFLFVFFFYKNRKSWIRLSGGFLLFYLLIVAIPFSRNALHNFISEEIKHVQYRISIINQPISDLLLKNEYTSFSTRKIIETAENQWFINSYISKEYDNKHTLNLRPYNRVGVNYNTQTRDVVLARFVIGEMGNMTMYLLLFLCFLPLLIYLLSYKFTTDEGPNTKINIKTYPGAVPLILFFTISLFVWLTSTNRFVFFGQDFPFLSLTSKTSVVAPLLLLGYTLVQRPKARSSETVNLRGGFVKYALFAGLIIFFALITVTPNTLSSKNFSVVVEKTQRAIDQELNAILNVVQDSLSATKPNFTYSDMITALKSHESYQDFLNEEITDPYTRSIVAQLTEKPYSAFQVNSPLYVQYDGYRYSAMYNQHFYLELPAVEHQEIWHGSIGQQRFEGSQQITLLMDNHAENVRVPSYQALSNTGVHMALLPQSWIPDARGTIALMDLRRGAEASKISVFKDSKNTFEQKSNSFVLALNGHDLAAIEREGSRSSIQFEDQANVFAFNKWINGRYRILYPQRPRNMWIYHFAQSIKEIYSEQDQYRDRYNISLDYVLNKKAEQIIHTANASKRADNKYKFSVIAADADGHIHLMQDFVSNRKPIDPNDNYTIFKLRQQQFFFSNIRNERDQWGEANLLNMMLGPGSSIKPLIAAAVTSQVNAGWEELILQGVNGDQTHYAGFKMVKPWIREVQDAGSFTLINYIQNSSNFYQSLMMFLGSYPKSSFVKEGEASLGHILSSNPGAANTFPVVTFKAQTMFLPAYNRGNNNWPRTDYSGDNNKTYFGNENSLLANGLEINANLITKEKSKENMYAGAYDRVNLIDSASYQLLQHKGSSNYLWSMPEESSFLQSLRADPEIHQNVIIGLKTATLGGYPYQLSPFKMLEMFGSMITQNRAYRLHLHEADTRVAPWYTDSTWNGNYRHFFAAQIMQGMANVVSSGTARNLARPKGEYFYYAKTGTINEQGSGAKSSKRLIVAISDKDLTKPEHIGNAKVYLLYFMEDRAGASINWSLVNQLVQEAMNSAGFKSYFNK